MRSPGRPTIASGVSSGVSLPEQENQQESQQAKLPASLKEELCTMAQSGRNTDATPDVPATNGEA